MTSDAQGPYSPAETCTSCSHQSFWHGSGAPRCSFMVQGKILCGCTNLRFQGRAQQPDDALRVAARALVSAYTGSNHYYMLAGVRSKREAQVLGAILYELWMGNYDGAHQCLAALRS